MKTVQRNEWPLTLTGGVLVLLTHKSSIIISTCFTKFYFYQHWFLCCRTNDTCWYSNLIWHPGQCVQDRLIFFHYFIRLNWIRISFCSMHYTYTVYICCSWTWELLLRVLITEHKWELRRKKYTEMTVLTASLMIDCLGASAYEWPGLLKDCYSLHCWSQWTHRSDFHMKR